MNKELKQRIDEIPGDEGWIKGNDGAMKVAEEMLAHGADDDTVENWISTIFWDAASMYGA